MGHRQRVRAHVRILGFLSCIVAAALTGCQGPEGLDSGSDTATDNNSGSGAGPSDQMYLTLDDDGNVDPAEYRIIANIADAAEPREWNFLVQPVNDTLNPGYRFVWDFGVTGSQTSEGADQAFTFPAGGTYVVTVTALRTNDTVAFVLTLEVDISAISDEAPIADAGSDVAVDEGEQVCLDGSSSYDPNGDTVTLSWSELSGEVVVLAPDSANAAIVCFQAPEVDADTQLVFALTASDGVNSSDDTVTVDVRNNVAPAGEVVAVAGPDQSVRPRARVRLDGSASTGPAGVPLSWQWTQVAGPYVSISGVTEPVATVTAPVTTTPIMLTFRLTVSAGDATAMDEVNVTVSAQGASGGGAGSVDQCPNDPNKMTPGVCGCGVPDDDSDADGVADCIDVCPGAPEVDSDGDGMLDCFDLCPSDPKKTEAGVCGCGIADTDADADGLPDCLDDCPNGLDMDSDADGVLDCHDGCPGDPDKTEPGICGCGQSDLDSDADGIPDCNDQCSGTPDVDSDGDGALDCNDGCPADPDKTDPGACGCGVTDTNSDGDGTPDCLEPAGLCTDVTSLDFGSAATSLSFEAWNCGSGALTYSVSDDAAWMNVSPSSGSSGGEHDTLTVSVDRTGLANNTYTGHVTLISPTAAAISLLVTMNVQTASGPPLTPIARWDVVPYQRISPGQTFKCGVVAFSRNGIQKVRFRVNGGAAVDVTSMTYNDRSNVYEYWLPIAASSFSSAGEISVDAVVYGNNGGTRTLETLPLVVDPNNTLPQPEAWVDASSGSDSTGTVGNSGRPYKTIGRAVDAVRAWMSANGHGSKADGGIVHLKPGTHKMDNGGVTADISTGAEWLTITTDAGGTRANTKIVGKNTSMPKTSLIRIKGVTVQSTGGYGYALVGASGLPDGNLWLDDCDIIGSGWHTAGSHPVHQSSIGTIWYSESRIYDVDFAVGGGHFARGLDIEHFGNDAFQHCPMIVNCTATDQDPGDTGWHADAWQWFATSGPNNTIVYNFNFTDGHCQGVMCRTGVSTSPSAECVAFVNFFCELRPPSRRPNGPASLWMRSADHFLMQNCTYVGHPFNIYDDDEGGTKFGTVITNFDVRGSCFEAMKHSTPVGNVDFSAFDKNHFVTGSGVQIVAPGSNVTTGSAGLVIDTSSPDFGRPANASSPLVNRVFPLLVPEDASGRQRIAPAAVGALER